jgi:putative membrane protein
MLERALTYLGGLPAFAAYFASAVILLALFVAIYVKTTPYPELTLIREGNVAAAISLSGAMIGFVLPVASSIEHSVSLLDMLLWSVVALVVQLIAYALVRLVLPHLAQKIGQGDIASGVFLAGTSITLGLLNAAAMTY